MGRARGVGDNTTRTRHGNSGVEQIALQRPERGQVTRTAAPPGLGAAAQGTDARARGVDERPVGGRVGQRIASVGHQHLVGTGRQRMPDQLCAMGVLLDRDQPTTASADLAREQRRLASGTGGEIDPDLVSTLDRHRREGEGDELTALVLHAYPA